MQKGDIHVAKIIKTRGTNGELFPSSLIAISDELYHCITEAIERQFGTKIRRITHSTIEKRLVTLGFRDIIIISKKSETIFLPVTVTDISFPVSHECGTVGACLLLPLQGEYQRVQKLIEGIIEETGLEHACCAQNGIEIKITLTGKFLPYQIIPNPFSQNGNGQKAFATRKEILSGCSSIR
jgi:hypothetical protein